MAEQTRMISRRLREEGKLKPPPMPSIVPPIPFNEPQTHHDDLDDMYMNPPNSHDHQDINMIAPSPEPLPDTKFIVHERRAKELSWNIVPDYFLKYRDHDAFPEVRPSVEREHLLPRKPAITTKLNKKAKKKKQKELLVYVQQHDPAVAEFVKDVAELRP